MSNKKIFSRNFRTDETIKKTLKITRSELAQYRREKKKLTYALNKETNELIKIDTQTQDIRKMIEKYEDENQKNKINIFNKWKVPYKKRSNNRVLNGDNEQMMNENNVIFLKDINELYKTNQEIKLFIIIYFILKISDYEGERMIKFNFEGNVNDVSRKMTQKINDYYEQIIRSVGIDKRDSIIINKNMSINNVFKDKTYKIINHLYVGDDFTLDNMKLREEQNFNICNLYNEVIEIKNKDTNCVKKYLKDTLTKISDKTIDKIGDDEGVTPNDIINLSRKYNIKCILYDICGKIIKSHYPTIKNKNYKNIVGIAYNNHLYPIKNDILNKNKIILESKIINDVQQSFNDLLKNDIMPNNVNISFYKNDYMISSYVNDKIQYVYNDTYNICKEIYEKYGISDYLTPFTNIKNCIKNIENLYIKENISSFFPYEFSKSGFLYRKKMTSKYIKNNYNDFLTIDKNKSYPHSLSSLNFLISCDVRTAKITKFNKNNVCNSVIEHYLYIVKPKIPSIYMPDVNIYSGEYIYYCYESGFQDFEILEEIETKRHENYYKQFINDFFMKNQDIFKKSNLQIKDTLNIMIGKFEKSYEMKETYKVIKLCNLSERMADKGLYIRHEYDTNKSIYIKIEKNKNITNIYNKKPIAYQIKDKARMTVIEKIKELNIKMKDIINIEVDSVTILNKNNEYDYIKTHKDINDNFKGWKIINKKIDRISGYEIEVDENESLTFEIEKDDNKNILYNCSAGSGKTYKIINDIIPNKCDDTDYIIITPCHTASKIYYKNNFNCKVIQTFTLSGSIPKENNIIIDEFGLIDKKGHDLLYKCHLLGKNIYAFGDFTQKLPIFENKHFCEKNYFNMIFNKQMIMNTNYRNNFSIEYYESLKNNKINLIDEVKKYSNVDYKTSDIILCFTNNKVNEYNELMKEHLKIKDISDVNTKVICKTNDLSDKEIFNNNDYVIIKNDNNYITFDDGTIITIDELKHNFTFGYAINTYKAQGQEFKSFYFPPEELKYLKNNGREVYTLISRLKQELTEETIKRNENMTKLKQ